MIEDKTSGKILAQAETWQAVDSQMLVFDNIEFADDRQISQFAPVLANGVRNRHIRISSWGMVTMG